jgi:hypothetical protein
MRSLLFTYVTINRLTAGGLTVVIVRTHTAGDSDEQSAAEKHSSIHFRIQKASGVRLRRFSRVVLSCDTAVS